MEKSVETSQTKKSLHIAMLPWFAYGHINPFIDLSNKLTSLGFQISFFSIPGNIPRIQSSLNLSPPNQLIPLAIPSSIHGLPSNFDSATDINSQSMPLLFEALDCMQPMIEAHLLEIKPNIVCFDFAHYWLPSIASQLGIKAVFFSVFSAVANSYLVVPSRMSVHLTCNIDDLKKPPSGFPKSSSIASCRTFEARDFMYLFTRFNGKPSLFEKSMSMCKTCDAFIYKSCPEMDGIYIDYIKSQFNKQVLLMGLPVSGPTLGVLETRWSTWLNQFEDKSVIFCNFGSETYLNKDQIEQLTLGLELTGLPFFLILNFGSSLDAQKKLEDSLPNGFKERVTDRGVIHTGWVQQKNILEHKNVGYYCCHAGFSSVIEGIISDCRLVLVPQKGDQFMNSKLLSGDLKIGVEVNRRDEDGYFGKEDIVEAVKRVMVDESVRVTMKKWKEMLLDREKQEKYVEVLVDELITLASK